MKKNLSVASLCVHAGTQAERGGLNTPIYTSSAFQYRTAAGNIYPRYFNTPNQKSLTSKISALEYAENSLVTSSGMAAFAAIMTGLLQKDDHILFQKQLYGGSHNFVFSEFERFGIAYDLVEKPTAEEFSKKIKPETKLIYIETPSNPLLEVVDIKEIADFAKSKNIFSVIDNTFASPINQNPILLGIDVVMHSGTKYMGGHSDICFGSVSTSKHLIEKIHKHALNFGASLDAHTCYLIERSLKTLQIRVERQNENALKIARFLEKHPKVSKVNYPALESHPNFEIAKKQMKGFGGMLSFEIRNAGKTEADHFLDHLQLIDAALSLGGVETTICVPSVTSHIKLSAEERKLAGISDGLLRLSVGIEGVEDLIQDLDNALNA